MRCRRVEAGGASTSGPWAPGGTPADREVMVPLGDAAPHREPAAPEEATALIGERGHSRLPLFRDRIDNMVGLVTAMDLLRQGAEVTELRALMRPPVFVPETKRIDDLLREMQKAR